MKQNPLTCYRVFDPSDLMEVLCVGQAQRTHTERMPRFLQTCQGTGRKSEIGTATYLEVPVEVLPPHVHVV